MKSRLAVVIAALALSLGFLAVVRGQEKPEEKKDEKKWDVENPPYPMPVEARIDTDEGTWMSLDVSPDGAEIVFDLLGDIYALPAAGGEARALTSGVAWDMQPRYSPDGKRIAFTSDRAGGDNIWVMSRDGSAPVQVSKETFRLTDSPVWSPDGDFIAARKHFTGTRSLGSGEIWLYHRSGGEGLQMTKRQNEQKDLGSPPSRPTGATSTTARTSRRGASSSTTRIPTTRSTRSRGSTG